MGQSGKTVFVVALVVMALVAVPDVRASEWAEVSDMVNPSVKVLRLDASFRYYPEYPVVGQPVYFEDTSDGHPIFWEWNFDDGATSDEQNPIHIFIDDGQFEVRLTVRDTEFNESDEVEEIEIYIDVRPPVADFRWAPALPLAGEPVVFVGFSTGGPGSTWVWDFGDGAPSTDRTATHTYTESGEYEVELTVTNDQGASDVTKQFVVYDGPVLEEAYFIAAASLSSGAEGSFYQTDVDINNWSDETATFRFLWLPRGADNSTPSDSEAFTLAAGQSARYENVLAEVFGLEPNVNGALAILSDSAELVIMSRTYNLPTVKVSGTFGQAISGIPASQLIGNGDTGRIIFMSENQDFRANLGCVNGVSESVQITLNLYDESGQFLLGQSMQLDAWSNKQINRIFGDFAPTNGYVDVSSGTPGAAYTCYGSVLDNGSSDPTTIVPVVR